MGWQRRLAIPTAVALRGAEPEFAGEEPFDYALLGSEEIVAFAPTTLLRLEPATGPVQGNSHLVVSGSGLAGPSFKLCHATSIFTSSRSPVPNADTRSYQSVSRGKVSTIGISAGNALWIIHTIPQT